ncbi:hypothetical protein PMAYCL1PPCAC_25547, partial [Pristionchus mayeri]
IKIGDKKLHVSKEYLSVHSPVFKTLFFGDFAEKNKEEVEIKDIVYEEFLDLLHLVYFRTSELTDRNVSHVLKLADRFQMARIMTLCENYLKQSTGFNEMKKLIFADQYRLAFLRVLLLSASTIFLFQLLVCSTPEYDHFSADMKVAICDRIMEL